MEQLDKEISSEEKVNSDFIVRLKELIEQELEFAKSFALTHSKEYEETQNEIHLKTLVSLGSLLWDLNENISSILEPIKNDVRQSAIDAHEPGFKGYVGIPGLFPEDNCTVNILRASTRLQSSVDMTNLRESLGRTFDLFINTKYEVAKDFETHVEKVASTVEREALLEVVEQRENKPRVSFKRKKMR